MDSISRNYVVSKIHTLHAFLTLGYHLWLSDFSLLLKRNTLSNDSTSKKLYRTITALLSLHRSHERLLDGAALKDHAI